MTPAPVSAVCGEEGARLMGEIADAIKLMISYYHNAELQNVIRGEPS